MAELVELIYTEERRGTGKNGDPVRLVKQWWTKDGQLVVEKDERLEQEKFPSRTELLRDIEYSTRRIENMQAEIDRLWGELQTTQGKIIQYENDLARYAELVGPLESMPTTLMHVLRAAARRFLTSGRSEYKDIPKEELFLRAENNLSVARDITYTDSLATRQQGWKQLLDAINYLIMTADNYRRDLLPDKE